MTEREARDQEPVTITDKRKIDPETGTVRSSDAEQEVFDPADSSAVPTGTAEGDVPAQVTEEDTSAGVDVGEAPFEELARVAAQLEERTTDLQRLQAQFANYKRRVARDEQLAAEAARAKVLTELLTVLDDLERARAHGDLDSGPLKAVADKLQTVLVGQGLVPFGAEGEDFDPELHEAVQHEGDGADPVIGMVLRQGYSLGDRVLRHAMVSVVDRSSSHDKADADVRVSSAEED
ncbi:nucleotide exchange factor GrpE [Hoyosella subflava]|uniref:Protein GrpE n=1 Tax=Hoyosella subflava (strain DSM 45089 / JCM 17490 / NBRC 109087 / DQS3-9A1) TaxID=443218 RepID=F6EJ98_HOYSD|nr:nucleotide exchange factor GrpE [Hoyosella subflava]AEF42514.1 Protein grpE [Hoyosella subflava DQS3-9A1]